MSLGEDVSRRVVLQFLRRILDEPDGLTFFQEPIRTHQLSSNKAFAIDTDDPRFAGEAGSCQENCVFSDADGIHGERVWWLLTQCTQNSGEFQGAGGGY